MTDTSIQQHLGPDDEALAAFAAADQDTPMAAMNLFRFHPRAMYRESDREYGTPEAQISGEEALARYIAVAAPLVDGLGGRLLLTAPVTQMFVGPADAGWDQVTILFFPTRAAFQAMMDDPGYRDALRHRDAALKNWRLMLLDGSGFDTGG